jgi:hypothetical protein
LLPADQYKRGAAVSRETFKPLNFLLPPRHPPR